MRLGLNLGAGVAGTDRPRTDNVDTVGIGLAREADRLGYDSVWAPEAYGADAATVLAYLAAQTARVHLGSAVFQIPARTPAMTAMTAASLDALSGGRFRLGLGVSGPQVSEGWHGVRFDRPLSRTREYVEIVRSVLARETLAFDGEHWTLPLPGGPGKALRLALHPLRSTIPLYLAAVGPRNLELAGEVADGWLAVFFSPEHAKDLVDHVRVGRERAGKDLAGFDVVPAVPVAVGPDPQECAAALRPHAALYIGGMGSREQNFYNRLAVRMGYAAAAAEIQDLYLGRRHRDAAAAVPFDFIDQTALVGPKERIRDRLAAYAEAGVTTLTITPHGGSTDERVATLRTLAEALDESGLGE